MWFVGFAHPSAPVVGFVGHDLQAHDASQLFALLDAVESPPPLRDHVIVASCSEGSAAVLVGTSNDPQEIAQFSTMMQLAAADLLGDAPHDVRLSRQSRPSRVTAARTIADMTAYFEVRFPPNRRDWDAVPAHARARGLWRLGERARAIAILEDACRTSQQALDHFHLGELFAIELKRPADAVAHLRRASQLAPDRSEPHTTLAIALSMAGDVDGAIAAATRATELARDDAAAWANLAQCYAAKHDVKQMRAAAKRAQKLQPGEPITAQLLRGR